MKLFLKNNHMFPTLPSFFDDFLTKDFFDKTSSKTTLPAVNVKENEKEFILEVAAPGMNKDDFKVEVVDNILSISSEKEESSEEKDKKGNYTRKEFSYQRFERSFTLPLQMVDVDGINASYKDGILGLTIPKKQELLGNSTKKITIG